jgi:ABC-type multidrug transport system permease subunit
MQPSAVPDPPRGAADVSAPPPPTAAPGWRPSLTRRGGHSALVELIRVRLLEFLREPEVVFWVYGFPVLLVATLGIAYRERPVNVVRVDVAADGAATATAAALAAPAAGVEASVRSIAEGLERLRTGRTDLVAERIAAGGGAAGGDAGFRYHFDPTRPESVLARDRAADALERAAGRRDLLAAEDMPQTVPGSRYIDFLVPGLMALSLMSGGLWGVGFITVELRIRKLLKRFLATPMRRWQFLVSIMLGRMLLMIPEMLLLVLFARWAFGVRVFGSGGTVALLVLLGSLCFSGLGLLVASRAKTLEAVSGALNAVMLPMWLTSGVFFPRERYPEAVQPLLRALPLTALVDALRAVMLEGRPLSGCAAEVGTLAAWTLVSFAVALRIFRWV